MATRSNDPLVGWTESGFEALARGEYFVAHEHFERAWVASGERRSLELHALAQFAAALHKHEAHRKTVAARTIMRRARAKLAAIDVSSFAIDLERLRADVDSWLSGDVRAVPRIVRTR